MLGFLKQGSAKDVASQVRSLLEVEKKLDDLSRRGFWHTYLNRTFSYYSLDLAALRARNPSGPERADLDTLELEMDAIAARAMSILARTRPAEWRADATVLQSFLMSNVVSARAVRHLASFEEMWWTYVDLCHDLGLKPSLERLGDVRAGGARWHESPALGATVAVPIHWTAVKEPSRLTDGAHLLFCGPTEQSIRTTVTIHGAPKPRPDIGPEEYAKSKVTAASDQAARKDLVPVQVGRYAGRFLRLQLSGRRQGQCVVCWVTESMVWDAWLTAATAALDRYIPTLQYMLLSFKDFVPVPAAAAQRDQPSPESRSRFSGAETTYLRQLGV